MEVLIIGLIFLAVIILIICLCIKSKNKNTDKYTHYEPKPYISPKPYVLHKPVVDIDKPILSTHASERMAERLGVYGIKQKELMKNAFKYGKTSDRTAGDIRIRLEDIERRNNDEEDVIVKYYSGSVFIFASDDKVLKTVYKLDNDYNYHGIYH